MKKLFVQTLRALVCAGSIAAAAAANPTITIGGVVFSDTNFTTIHGLVINTNGGGTVYEAPIYNSGQSTVARGDFLYVFATDQINGTNALYVYALGSTNTWWAPVNGLSATGVGTFAANVFILEWNLGTAQFTFRSMSGGLSGVVSDVLVDETEDKIFFAGDFGTSFTTYRDFRVWDIGNIAWDTYTMKLSGYDGYWPEFMEKLVGTDTIRVHLSEFADAYGGTVDDVYGWQTIPWSTETVDWDISSHYWFNPQ